MALPLKSGADLYNNQALRLRLHNLGADPTEVGAGLIYFNTSTGLNTSQKARLYTGSAWKTIAFSEDLDVASNADFLALKERVDLLSGDVDTDAIISNMKEVSAFLEGFAEDASLMDYLNTELGKKLDLTGGTINGNLLIGASDNTSYRYLQFARSGYGSRINVADGDLYVSFGGIDANGGLTATKAFSLGNNGIRYASDGKTYHDILTSAGGTMTGSTGNILVINRTSGNPIITFQSNGTVIGRLGINVNGYPIFGTAEGGAHTLLHSGNVGEYAMKTDGSNEMTGALLLNHTNPRIAFMAGGKTYGSLGYFADGLKWYVNSENAYHAIAFTDSNVASATKLATPRTIWGQSFDGTADVSGALHLGTGTIRSSKSGTDLVFLDFGSQGDPYIGYGMAGAGIDSHLCGNTIYLHYGTSRANGLILNNSGNVTIGGSDLAGTTAKLYVDGRVYAKTAFLVDSDYGIWKGGQYTGALAMTDLVYNATKHAFINGNVLIGNTTDDGSGARLQVNGEVSSLGMQKFGFTTGDIWTDDNGKTHPWYGINFNYHNNGVFSTTISDYYGLTLKTASGYLAMDSYGKVFIGATTDNGSGAKLQVNGSISATDVIKGAYLIKGKTSQNYGIFMAGNYYSTDLASEDIAIKAPKVVVDGDLHVNGNIIADGEVSAGGAAEEGGNAGGGGAFHSEGIAVGATQTTIAHGLGTDDIVVSIYEKDGVSGRWSLILTDVEIVDANNIIVSFGSATSVEHKVVIMGAVA